MGVHLLLLGRPLLDREDRRTEDPALDAVPPIKGTVVVGSGRQHHGAVRGIDRGADRDRVGPFERHIGRRRRALGSGRVRGVAGQAD